MPLFDFKCPSCGNVEEKFLKSRDGSVEVVCVTCDIIMKKLPPLLAKTSTLWNAGWNAGLEGQGFHSRSLGKKVHSQREEENIMRAKGFIPESDFGKHFIDDQQERLAAEKKAGDAESQKWLDNVAKFDGNKELAAVETSPAHEMLKQ